jgi:hypothetical protein
MMEKDTQKDTQSIILQSMDNPSNFERDELGYKSVTSSRREAAYAAE